MNRFKWITFICLIIVFQQNEAKSQLLENSQLTDILNYSISVNISDNSDSVDCVAVIRLRALRDYKIFSLDLENPKSNGKGMLVHEVLKGKKNLAFIQFAGHLEIHDSIETEAEETVMYVIRYSGIPSDGLIISKNKFGKRTFFATNWQIYNKSRS